MTPFSRLPFSGRGLCIAFFLVLSLCISSIGEGKLPELTEKATKEKLSEIMKYHATYKTVTPEIVARSLKNYIDELDPIKTYFIESDIQKWLEPSDQLLDKILSDYEKSNFDEYEQIHAVMVQAIQRRHALDKLIDVNALPKKVNSREFKDMQWAKDDHELLNRLIRLRSLQIETAGKLNEETTEKSLQRLAKRQEKFEEKILQSDPVQKKRLILTDFLKSMAESLDSHTLYFTPDEATQFLINVQQRLFGIGASLRDDLNGLTVVKIVDGSPAALSKELKVKDRIIAVDGEPIVGMDMVDAVELIRGEEHTPVVLTIIREGGDEENKKEEKLDITIKRAEIVLKETRYESNVEPFGDGVIAYLKLFSFYQDDGSSSAADLTTELNRLKNEYHVLGLVLDLRFNTGGILAQAVDVAGMFITKGVVVSIKDETGHVQHLRDWDGKMVWDGPLMVLINRLSASASEIVAQSLQDYGRALIIGDDHSFGKGSFQSPTFNPTKKNDIPNPQGEYNVTRGRYYTVSGKTPQLKGVIPEIEVPGILSQSEIGEQFKKYPLENDTIPPNFDDDLSDIPFYQRDKVRLLYKFDLQPRLATYKPYLEILKKNSELRIKNNKAYQDFLDKLKKNQDPDVEEEYNDEFGKTDFQLIETYNIMRDYLFLKEPFPS